MKKINCITGKAIPLAMNNVDTDLIIPAQYLTAVTKSGYGKYLFRRLREADPAFSFNQTQFNVATILITLDNFGCGSSREHAVWALQEAGIQAVIATSFADIFYSNATKNDLVVISLPTAIIKSMLSIAKTGQFIVSIDIAELKITTNSGMDISFDLDRFRQYCLLQGIDDLDYLLQHTQEISYFHHQEERT